MNKTLCLLCSTALLNLASCDSEPSSFDESYERDRDAHIQDNWNRNGNPADGSR